MKDGIKKCKHLDDNDVVYITKHLLNGYIDVLRANIDWYGTSNDVDAT